MSLSIQNCLASPCLPSSISCWNFVSFIFMTISFQFSMSCLANNVGNGLALAGNGNSCLLTDLRRVDLNPVAGLDGRDRILVQFVHGGNFTGNGDADVDPVDLLTDEACGTMVRYLALVVEAEGSAGGAGRRGIDEDLAGHDLAFGVGAWRHDHAVLVADMVERPSDPLAIHHGFARCLAFRPGLTCQYDLLCHYTLLLSCLAPCPRLETRRRRSP